MVIPMYIHKKTCAIRGPQPRLFDKWECAKNECWHFDICKLLLELTEKKGEIK